MNQFTRASLVLSVLAWTATIVFGYWGIFAQSGSLGSAAFLSAAFALLLSVTTLIAWTMR